MLNARDPLQSNTGHGNGSTDRLIRSPSDDTSLESVARSQRMHSPMGFSSQSRVGVPHLPESMNPRSNASANSFTGSHFAKRKSGSARHNPFHIESTSAWQGNEAEADDWLHDVKDANKSGGMAVHGFPVRAIMNLGFLFILALALIGLFAGYPIISFFDAKRLSYMNKKGGYNLGGTNATGQIASVPGFRNIIDPDTPANVYTRTGYDNKTYQLVFSDEFNQDGRSFLPGDDPFWEAVDLHYWATNNFEWYDPVAVTTVDGKLKITLSQTPDHAEFPRRNASKLEQSAVGVTFSTPARPDRHTLHVQFCFTGGYIEAAINLPGAADVSGLWPAFWMMGNLGRAGYGASLEGTWPYSYESCDSGTLQNQTFANNTPIANLKGGLTAFNRAYNTMSTSWAAGQRLSACTCPGEDHPGPVVNGQFTGRAAPEIDIFEAQAGFGIGYTPPKRMQVSQSLQMAPFNINYTYANATLGKDKPAYELHQKTSQLNSYKGAVLQQAGSVITDVTPQTAVEDTGDDFSVYGVEYEPGVADSSHITWVSGGEPSWTLYSAAMAPDPVAGISRRPIANEPMYIIFNVGLSQSFGQVEFKKLADLWPVAMTVDYVRVYQPTDSINIGCDPPNYPTSDYINRHMPAYTNRDYLLWGNTPEEGGYGQPWPRNRLDDGCDAPPSTLPGNPNKPHQRAKYYPQDALPGFG